MIASKSSRNGNAGCRRVARRSVQHFAHEVAAIEARFGAVDRMAGLARSALLHPAVIAGGIVALLTIGRLRGMRLIGRLYLLTTAARRLIQVVRVLPRTRVDTKQGGQV